MVGDVCNVDGRHDWRTLRSFPCESCSPHSMQKAETMSALTCRCSGLLHILSMSSAYEVSSEWYIRSPSPLYSVLVICSWSYEA